MSLNIDFRIDEFENQLLEREYRIYRMTIVGGHTSGRYDIDYDNPSSVPLTFPSIRMAVAYVQKEKQRIDDHNKRQKVRTKSFILNSDMSDLVEIEVESNE